MTVQYIHLDYEAYKELEAQMKEFKETVHTTVTGFYHKSIRLRIGQDLIMEFHGAQVGGYGHLDEKEPQAAMRTTLDGGCPLDTEPLRLNPDGR